MDRSYLFFLKKIELPLDGRENIDHRLVMLCGGVYCETIVRSQFSANITSKLTSLVKYYIYVESAAVLLMFQMHFEFI